LFEGMKQDLKAIGDTFSVETISKLNNLKIENTLDNSLFNELYQKIYAKYGNKDMAAVVAADVIM